MNPVGRCCVAAQISKRSCSTTSFLFWGGDAAPPYRRFMGRIAGLDTSLLDEFDLETLRQSYGWTSRRKKRGAVLVAAGTDWLTRRVWAAR